MEHPLTAAGTAAAVRSGRSTAAEVVAAALARIDEHDPVLGAFEVVDHEGARAAAAALDRRGDLADLPLAGVPVAIKDNVDVAGLATRLGSAATSPAPATEDHPVVQRLRAAGAVVVGKTRVPELCIYPLTDNVFGVSRNPWDVEYTPGGSSGGAAAAVAAGLVPLAQGSDGLGSIRIPSACCGVLGIKPGPGVVAKRPGEADWDGLTEHGPIATTLEDLALGLSVLSGRPFGGVEPPAAPLRVAVSTRSPAPWMPADRQWRAAARRVADLLEHAGHTVTAADPAYGVNLLNVALGRWGAGVAADAAGLDRDRLLRRTRRHAALGSVADRLGLTAPRHRDAWRERVAGFFSSYDVLVTPTLARFGPRAVRWSERGLLANVLTSAAYAPFPGPWNLAAVPALAVPAGVAANGRPLSVQLVAPAGGEDLLLSVARLIEQLQPWPRLAPAFSRRGARARAAPAGPSGP